MPRKQNTPKPAPKREYKRKDSSPKGRDGFGDDRKPAERKVKDFGTDRFERKPRSFDSQPERKTRGGFGDDKKPFTRKSDGGFGEEKKPYERKARSFDSGDKKPYERKTHGGFGDDKKPFTRKSDGGFGDEKKPYERKARSFDSGDKKPYERKTRGGIGDDKKPFTRKSDSGFGDEKKPYERKARSFDSGNKKPYERKTRGGFGDDKKPFTRKSDGGFGDEKKPYERKARSFDSEDKKPYERRSGSPFPGADRKTYKKAGSKEFNAQKAYERKSGLEKKAKESQREDDGTIRLNKYISNAGICSRREADVLIQSGAVKVNGKVITEMGYRVQPNDTVNYGGETLRKERPVYMLMNKPKDYITTTDDPKERRTIMHLVKHNGPERLYPVGRLDRNTTGLLLITNDGELAKKLTHPSSRIKKIYHVYLDKNLKVADYQQLLEGVELEDGFIKPDAVEFVAGSEDKKEVGVEMHSGRNRIVRRMFEHLGYTVVKLDRVTFAGLTKKDLARGRTRYLTDKEVGMLKML